LKLYKKRKKDEAKQLELAEAEAAAERSAISVVATLCVQLQVGQVVGSKNDALPRLVAKFLEDDLIKVLFN
jgi:hypothetical protein